MSSLTLDPDRWVNPQSPGAHEWWYFDAISDDGEDALVLVWYAALPFDPAYGLASLRHIRQPDRYPKPNPLDHCAIGFSWYHKGKTVAYALNAFQADQFSHGLTEGSLDLNVSRNQLNRSPDGRYQLQVQTPVLGLGKKHAHVDLEFIPNHHMTAWERELGREGHSHLWILAAADCIVQGEVRVGKKLLKFQGRGYHDHNAGDDELSRSFEKWYWGRFHHDQSTTVYYVCESMSGQSEGLWLECDSGQVKSFDSMKSLACQDPKRTVFGISYHEQMSSPDGLANWSLGKPVDQGPFYLRWVSRHSQICPRSGHGLGFSELLQANNLNRPLFNWMIPYRLKRP